MSSGWRHLSLYQCQWILHWRKIMEDQQGPCGDSGPWGISMASLITAEMEKVTVECSQSTKQRRVRREKGIPQGWLLLEFNTGSGFFVLFALSLHSNFLGLLLFQFPASVARESKSLPKNIKNLEKPFLPQQSCFEDCCILWAQKSMY